IGVFTVMHYLLNIAYAVVVLVAIHGADRAPSLIIAVMFGALTLEGGIAMVTNLLAQAALGSVAWIEILGGSLIATGIAIVLLMRTHPLAAYLRRAEEETCKRELAARSLDQTASLGVGYSFEAIVRPKLAIDVVQVVPECLRRDLQ